MLSCQNTIREGEYFREERFTLFSFQIIHMQLSLKVLTFHLKNSFFTLYFFVEKVKDSVSSLN